MSISARPSHWCDMLSRNNSVWLFMVVPCPPAQSQLTLLLLCGANVSDLSCAPCYNSLLSLLSLNWNDSGVETQIQTIFVGFVNDMLHADNKCLQLAIRIALNGSGSAVCNSINVICWKNCIDKHNTHEGILIVLRTSACDHDLFAATLIQKFIVFKWGIETSCQDAEHAE